MTNMYYLLLNKDYFFFNLYVGKLGYIKQQKNYLFL